MHVRCKFKSWSNKKLTHFTNFCISNFPIYGLHIFIELFYLPNAVYNKALVLSPYFPEALYSRRLNSSRCVKYFMKRNSLNFFIPFNLFD